MKRACILIGILAILLGCLPLMKSCTDSMVKQIAETQRARQAWVNGCFKAGGTIINNYKAKDLCVLRDGRIWGWR